MRTFQSPWEIFAVEERKTLAHFFNHCQFTAAAKIAAQLAERDLHEIDKTLARRLRLLAEAYEQWDRFEYAKAANQLDQVSLSSDEAIAIEQKVAPGIIRLYEQAREHRNLLLRYKTDTNDFARPAFYLIADLLSNATRRASQGRFDDAVLRLYRALEMHGQIAFYRCFGCSPSKVETNKLRARIPVAKHSQIMDKNHYAMNDVFYHLALAGEKEGLAFQRREADVKELQSGRNLSMLAHGYQPLREKSYEKLRAMVQSFLPPEALIPIDFPHLPW